MISLHTIYIHSLNNFSIFKLTWAHSGWLSRPRIMSIALCNGVHYLWGVPGSISGVSSPGDQSASILHFLWEYVQAVSASLSLTSSFFLDACGHRYRASSCFPCSRVLTMSLVTEKYLVCYRCREMKVTFLPVLRAVPLSFPAERG